MSPVFFESADMCRAWLEQNHGSAAELMVGFRKVCSGLPSMTWPESVDEALCFGWIDGVRRCIDDTAYVIQFTPRRKESIWSAVSLAKVSDLIAQGRMRPAGMKAYESRNEKKTGVYAFDQTQPIELSAVEARAFSRNKVAWNYFESAAPSYRKVMTYWVVSAKRPPARARRLAQLIQAYVEGRRILR